MQELQDGEYAVRHDRLPAVRDRFERLAKKARKVGAPEPAFAIVRDFERKVGPHWNQHTELWHAITVTGEAPVLPGGWQLAGTIQHTEVGNAVRLTTAAEDAGIDARTYREGAPFCDHCKTSRNRRDTYLVIRTTEVHDERLYELKQVGTNCIRDFLGHETPEAALAYAAALWDLLGDLDEEREYGGEGGGIRDRSTVNLYDYLGEVIASIEAHGWLPKSRARFDETPTSAEAANNLFAIERKFRTNEPATEEQLQEADATITWVRDHFEDADVYALDDYENNLRVATLRDWIEPREMGLAASAVSYYRRAIQREIELAERKARGPAGEAPEGRADVTGRVSKVQEYASDYSPDPVYKMTVVLENGSRVWTTVPAAISSVEAGDTIKFRATFTRSNDDPTFAFGKRPSNATIVKEDESA